MPLNYRLQWVQAFGDAQGARFNGLWEQRQSAAWEARHGIPDGDYQTHFDAQVRNGFRLRCISAYGEGGAIAYATLWDQGGRAVNGIPRWPTYDLFM